MSEPSTPPIQDENQLIAERRAKLAQWRESGKAYPNDFSREKTAGKIDEHRKQIVGMFFGALLIPGVFAFLPGRIMGIWLYG